MNKDRTSIKAIDIFWIFLKIGSVAFGGVYSMLTFFRRELVDKRRWLTDEEFAEGVAIGQMTPGAPVVNTGIFIGYRLRRLRGVLATTIGQVLPSFIAILIIAYFYIQYRDVKLIQSILKGVAASVVGLIASVVYSMGKKLLKDYKGILFAASSFVCLAIFKINPIALILLAGIIGLIVYRKGS